MASSTWGKFCFCFNWRPQDFTGDSKKLNEMKKTKILNQVFFSTKLKSHKKHAENAALR